MMGLFRSGRLAAAIGLIAAYAVALQAVFTTLAPVEARADGTFAVYCSGSGNAVAPDAGDPAAPAPVSGKMQCVLCGACAAGFVILPVTDSPAYDPAERLVARVPAPCCDWHAASDVPAGPARAPPFSV